MKIRILSVIAAAALLAACAEEPKTASTTNNTGVMTPSQPMQPPGSQIVAGSQADLVANVGDRVFFDFDKYSVKPDGKATLDRQAAWLAKYPKNNLVIEGHADERGTREYNLALGERRAKSIKDYLVAKGVAASRLKIISYGKERPVALGSNEAAWSQNRRGVSVVAP